MTWTVLAEIEVSDGEMGGVRVGQVASFFPETLLVGQASTKSTYVKVTEGPVSSGEAEKLLRIIDKITGSSRLAIVALQEGQETYHVYAPKIS